MDIAGDEGSEFVPQARTRMRNEQVDIMVDGRGGGDLTERLGDPRRPEHRQSFRQPAGRGVGAEAIADGGEILRGMRSADLLADRAPESGLPGEIVPQGSTGTVEVVTGRPVGDQGRP